MKVGALAMVVAFWAAAGCGGEEFAGKSGTGGAAGSAGASGSGGATGGSGGATGGTGGATGGTGGATGGTGGATGGTGGLPACGGGVCAPAVPGGWSGPIAIIDAAAKTAASCSGGYPSEVLFAHNQLSGAPPAAQCGCSCDASGVICSNVRIDAHVGTGGCTGAACCADTACTTVSLGDGTCVAAGPALCSGVTHAQVKADVNKSCTPSTLTNLDNIDWTRTIRGCAPTSSSSCTTGTCVPQPGSPTTGRICIYKDGDSGCSGAYSQKIATWETQDKRTCSSSCSCLSPSCGSVQPYTAQNCASPLGGPAPVPMGCAAAFAGSGIQSAKFTAAAPSCLAVGSPVAGGEVQQDPVTICCLPG